MTKKSMQKALGKKTNEGQCIIIKNNSVFLKYPFKRSHKTRGQKVYKTEKVCRIPLTKEQLREARNMVSLMADARAKTWFEFDKLGITPDYMKPKDYTFKDLATMFIEKEGLAVGKEIQDCLDKFGTNLVKDISTADVQEWLEELKDMKAVRYCKYTQTYQTTDKTIGKGSINSRLKWLSKIFRYGLSLNKESNRVLEYNPANGVQWEKPKARQKHIEYEDFKKLLTELETAGVRGKKSPHMPLLVQIAYFTGMRRQEIVDLTWGQIDLDSVTPHISLKAEDTKTKVAREIPLMPNLVTLLEAHKGNVTPFPKNRIFGTWKGNSINHCWNQAKEKVGLTQRLHDCRTSAITNMEKAGVEDRINRLVVGHSLGSDVHADYNKHLPSLEEMHQEMLKMYHFLNPEAQAINQ